MATTLSFDRHLSESQRINNAVRHLGTPESIERMKTEAAKRAEQLALDDLVEGVCFAKIPWGNGNRHFLWCALITSEHFDGGGMYGAARTTMAVVEYFEKPETAPQERSKAFKPVDRAMFAQAEIFEGEDSLVLFQHVFADHPNMLERSAMHSYDVLMRLRAVEAFQRHPLVPGDDVGLHRLIKHLEDRRATMRKTTPSGLTVGLDFGEPMLD